MVSRALALLLFALTCCAGCRPARIVTVVVPYSALFYLDSSDGAIGRAGCDAANQPYKLISPYVKLADIPWTILHEETHVSQMRAFPGGCRAFASRYQLDEAFRLRAEAEAFCAVFDAQKLAKVTPSPSLIDMLYWLTAPPVGAFEGYRGHWTPGEAVRALRCWPRRSPADTAVMMR